MARSELSVDGLEAGIRAGDRALLARAITLVESTKPEHQALAEDLLQRIWSATGGAVRIGVTGVPGVGKSTFIEAFGSMLTAMGKKVAVLTVDPTSSRTGGSILGDKTRMQRLGHDPNAFIRPSPTSGTLGGVARKTRESMAFCEAAGFDVILVETVGVGQSETVVADMVDFFLVLALSDAGDELQGLKKGVLELADMIAVNKADGPLKERAEAAARDYVSALRIVRPMSENWSVPVETCSALKGEGLDRIWDTVLAHRKALTESGELPAKRRQQLVRWMWSMLEHRLFRMLSTHESVRALLPRMEAEVESGTLPPSRAVTLLIEAFGAGSAGRE